MNPKYLVVFYDANNRRAKEIMCDSFEEAEDIASLWTNAKIFTYARTTYPEPSRRFHV